MKVALINPYWSYTGSIYFGCREAHLPLELGYLYTILTRQGHDVILIDAHMFQVKLTTIRDQLSVFRPDFTVFTTAPTYLFWRCPPPELRVPQELLDHIRDIAGVTIAIGPHGSTTPVATLKKLNTNLVVMGESEEIVPLIVNRSGRDWSGIKSIAYMDRDSVTVQGTPHATNIHDLPALQWDDSIITAHIHHHHRFDETPKTPGAEMETSRGCPYQCSFCAKNSFRNRYRKRPYSVIKTELSRLVAQGVNYIYFIDEIFLPDEEILSMLMVQPVKFGIQTRIDLWSRETIDMLGKAGCVSVEAGVESISEKGRLKLNKQYIISHEEITDNLIYAKKKIPFVQATLINTGLDNTNAVENWRHYLLQFGVWANKPVPLFPYPGSEEYIKLWGKPDDEAWERAHNYYLSQYSSYSDIQEGSFLSLPELEMRSIHEQRIRISN